MDELWRNVRYSVRALMKRPDFTAIAVLTLALGIGATTAIFSVVRNVLLRPLPYDAPERIVQVWNPFTNEPGVLRGRSPLSSLDLAEMRTAVSSFERLAAYASQSSVNLTGGEVPERVVLTRASSDLFAVLGARTLIGRTFTAEDDVPGRDDVVVISYALWQRRFGGARNVLESTIQLDGEPQRVIGVLPPSFQLPADYLRDDQTDIWKPLALDVENLDRASHWLNAIALLRPDATLSRANAELEALTRTWIEQGFKISTIPPYYAVSIQDELFGGSRRALVILFGAVAFVLLIACANVANLLLARADGRRAEMALRTALGAGRARIITQLLWESMVLVALGGLVGLLLAWVGVQLLVALEPGNIPRIGEVRIDAVTLGFTAAVALLTAAVFGLVPAIQAWRPDPAVELRSGMRTVGGKRGASFRGALIVSEVALSLVLVIGAALLIRTFARLSSVDPGFDAESVLTFTVALPLSQYDDPGERVRFHSGLVQRLQDIPGVQDAGAVMTLPLTLRLSGGSIQIEGAEPRRPGESVPNARWQIVTPGYFEAMDYTLTEGRLLNPGDHASGAPAVVLNETMARMFWPNGPALGGRVRTTNDGVPWFTVAGIVRDVRHAGIVEQPSPTIYFTLDQAAVYAFAPRTMSFVLETSSPPLAFADRVRETVRAMDPTLPVAQLVAMETVVGSALAQPRFTMLLLSIFASLALVLAIIGIYGLLSYTVTRQWRDIGIRVALGASIGTVLRLVIWKGMRLALVGLAAGMIAAFFLVRVLERLLYGVRPLDPVTFIVVPALFTTVALAATWIPARRAAGVDPVRALRHE